MPTYQNKLVNKSIDSVGECINWLLHAVWVGWELISAVNVNCHVFNFFASNFEWDILSRHIKQ